MIRHVVVFEWKDGTTAERVAQFAADLAALPGKIPEIRDYRFGSDAGITDGNADFALVADFDDDEGYRAYATHPDHLPVIERVKPIIGRRLAVQMPMPMEGEA